MSADYPAQPILIVEDELECLNGLRSILDNRGITNVRYCLDGREAMALIRKERISVILLDLVMPHIPGEVLLEQIKREYPEIPVIVVTACGQLSVAGDCHAKRRV